MQFLFPLLQFFFTALTNEAEALIQRTLRLLARFFCLSSFFFGTTSPSEERRGGGSVALVPHSDSFKVAAGVPAVRRTDPLGRPLTRAKAELIARESGHGYKVVYLPSCYRLRIAATMYTLWLLSTCVLTAIPASSSASSLTLLYVLIKVTSAQSFSVDGHSPGLAFKVTSTTPTPSSSAFRRTLPITAFDRLR